MEEVLEKLSKTKFDGLYKNMGRDLDNQEERRREMLHYQKTNRSVLTDTFRGVLGLVEAVEESNIFQEERVTYKPQIYVAGFNRCAYKEVLMQSEWMVEKPDDFQENWYVVPCPKGIRTLVVASRGKTKLFSRDGILVRTIQSALPGGSQISPGRNSRCCILDGFLIPTTNTFYILDLLAWNSHLMADGETEFRHYWMLSQIEEIPDLGKRSKDNHLKFKIIPKVPCDPDSFRDFMMRIPHYPNFSPKLDGLLFYHKKAHYVSGLTPLVGWLYPYMVPEVFGPDTIDVDIFSNLFRLTIHGVLPLGAPDAESNTPRSGSRQVNRHPEDASLRDVKINPAYMMERPVNYVNQADFISKFPKKKERLRRSQRMDTTAPAPDANDLLVVEALTESGAFDLEEANRRNEATAVNME